MSHSQMVIKKCKAFYQCLEDRDHGKVKHCYEMAVKRAGLDPPHRHTMR
jgi:hypothetical protein